MNPATREPRGGRAAVRPVACVESIEGRRYCAADTFATATDLGAVNGLRSATGTVTAAGDTTDYFEFTLAQAGGLRVDFAGVTGNTNLSVYNAPSATALVGSATLTGLSHDVVTRASLPAGT